MYTTGQNYVNILICYRLVQTKLISFTLMSFIDCGTAPGQLVYIVGVLICFKLFLEIQKKNKYGLISSESSQILPIHLPLITT